MSNRTREVVSYVILETMVVGAVKALLTHGAVAAHGALAGHAATSGTTTILGSHAALAGNVVNLASQGALPFVQALSSLPPDAVSTIGHAALGAAASHATIASAVPAAHAAGGVSNALIGADALEMLGLAGIIAVAKHPVELVAEAIQLLRQGDTDKAKRLVKTALEEAKPLKPLLKADNWT
jgi:hypothetical protein